MRLSFSNITSNHSVGEDFKEKGGWSYGKN